MGILDHRVALVTGAKGGLGSFVTEAFLAAGATVVGVSRSIQQSDFPHPAFTAMPAEATAESSASVAAGVVARFGRIDALVHLIGGFAGGNPATDTDDATWEQMLSLNLRSAVFFVRAVVPHMRAAGSGRILAIGSRAAVEHPASLSAYVASKAALIGFICTVAAENRDASVTANIVLPGMMDTPVNRAAMPNADRSKWVQPARVAQLLVWLASEESGDMTGDVIPVYGRE